MWQITINGITRETSDQQFVDTLKEFGVTASLAVSGPVIISFPYVNEGKGYDMSDPIPGTAWDAMLKALVVANKKITAIKIARQLFGLGLGDAKAYVEKL